MLSTERDEFDKQLSVMFGGWPKMLLTTERREAYWRGLQAMPLSGFMRCVDHALGERGMESVPTANHVWSIYRELRTSRPPVRSGEGAERSSADAALRLRSMLAANEIRATMPKDRNGYVINPEYVPLRYRAELQAKWDLWHAENHGEIDRYQRLFMLQRHGNAA